VCSGDFKRSTVHLLCWEAILQRKGALVMQPVLRKRPCPETLCEWAFSQQSQQLPARRLYSAQILATQILQAVQVRIGCEKGAFFRCLHDAHIFQDTVHLTLKVSLLKLHLPSCDCLFLVDMNRGFGILPKGVCNERIKRAVVGSTAEIAKVEQPVKKCTLITICEECSRGHKEPLIARDDHLLEQATMLGVKATLAKLVAFVEKNNCQKLLLLLLLYLHSIRHLIQRDVSKVVR
jgi:hypothetical protein